MSKEAIGTPCKWCNGSGNDGCGVCPDCEATGTTGGKYGEKIRELMAEVSYLIQEERCHQNSKWGVQRHPYAVWLGILMEEVGEVAQAVNALTVPAASKATDADDLYNELIQVAAVAAAIAEQVLEDKKGGRTHGS